MKDNHGIRTTEAEVLAYIDHPVPSTQANDVISWLETYSTIPFPIEGIPVFNGFGCNLCSHYTRKRESMRIHIVQKHKGVSATAVEKLLQRPFGGWFKKYIYIENDDAKQAAMESWKEDLNEQFQSALRLNQSVGDGESMDIRLMNAFIAKVR